MEIFRRNIRYILAGLLPSLLIYSTFVIYPIIRSFFYGFYDWNGLSEPVYIGIKNFQSILTDGIFWLSFKNNLYLMFFSIFAQIPIGLVLAFVLSNKLKGGNFFRTAFFVPMILSTVVIGLLWSTILNPQIGILDGLLNQIGLGHFSQNWLGDPKYAMLSVCGVVVWQYFGLYMIIFLAAIQNISTDIMEAADIDGASKARKLISITLPILWPTVMTAVILCISGSMRSFDLVFTMTQGGPASATELMATYMYNKTFSVYQYGYGNAISMMIFIISFSIILMSQALMRKRLD